MKTSKAFSTISYNTTDYLKLKLDELVERRIFDFYALVEHFPEDDETKKHKHLYVVPSALYECSQLIDYLAETDTENPSEKPLTCIVPRSSKFGDWFLYSMHDKAYLASKGQTRKYSYALEDFIASESDYFSELRHQINYTAIRGYQRIIEAVENNIPFYQMVSNGQVPVPQIFQWQKFYELAKTSSTYRNGAKNHEPDIDYETGVVLVPITPPKPVKNGILHVDKEKANELGF